MRKERDKVEHYVVFDFETTGFSPQKNEIIQIGAVKYDQAHQEIARFNQLIKPTRSYLPTKISELTGIWPASLLDQPVLAEVLPDFIAFSRDSLMVAHNAPFDVSFLYQAIVDCEIGDAPHFQVYDTLSEAKKLVQMPNYKLETFKDVLGIDLRSHDALNDCLITARLYQYLQDLSRPPKPQPVLNESLQMDLFGEVDTRITEEVRRKLSLPITKDLVYYRRDTQRNWQKFEVTGLAITAAYSTGYSLTATLYNNDTVTIHSDFLKEMQKANFTNEIEKEG
ncbi:3'-5' exonuclease [Lactococcus formosensis]|uniref:DNA polymerase III polC-type n=1 Tax=Lactococcus formosensis TaxID=1281486 RepID=A0A9X4SC26_9LACT|nr:3'-5' exonuclease [Lactococcus formosensis]MCH1723699.1 3'-5' exonuclease [Lactococcus formosensis]MCO7181114.1 3'-5' exonuclease [Lactococcus formosensis]MDG6111458.1 3'-5' exonuclease [Lactococcus formosensis]MDG6112620.1 3'-5' exonuclease [Lactococcus formosensis]MDG6115371.1 3'-5' exonuclease [Lactococcus formosensis]